MSDDDFSSSLGCLKLQIDWDAGAGENWARAFDGPELTALFHRYLPIAFCMNVLPEMRWQPIQVSSFDEALVEDCPEVLARVFRCDLSTLSTPCSVNDLWFHTV